MSNLKSAIAKMIFGIGIDVVNIQRIGTMVDRWGDLFLGRIFTEREILWCQKRTRPPECFATRFAAKEAFLKAIGRGLRNGIRWTDIEVENDPLGKPLFSFHQRAKEVLETQRITKALLTLSHERSYAVAHVILEVGSACLPRPRRDRGRTGRVSNHSLPNLEEGYSDESSNR